MSCGNTFALPFKIVVALTSSFCLSGLLISKAMAEDDRIICNWNKLGLTDAQGKQVQQTESDWEAKYSELMPALVEDQKHLSKLLEEHGSDPIELMAVQSSIARRREQLSALALTAYLKKKEVLDDNQKHTLELMMKRAIAERQRSDESAYTNEEMPDHTQELMQRVRNIWPVQGER